jgi:hypothetical protein
VHDNWDVVLLWRIAPLRQNFYFVFLVAITLFTVISVFQVWRSLGDQKRQLLASRRLATLRQLHLFAILLLQFILADGIFRGIRATQLSKISLCPVGLEAFDPVLALALVATTTLLALHALQWLPAHRLNRAIATEVNPELPPAR